MKKLTFLLFLTIFVACSSAQKSAKTAIKVPDAIKSYYKEIDFTKTGKALYDDLAVLTISKHTPINSVISTYTSAMQVLPIPKT